MKISETWLRTYVNPALSTEELVAQITMAGLEVDAVEPVAAEFSGVVVGEVVEMEKHPDADKLNVCRVNVGETELLQIVCGAANVRVGLKIPAALCGAILPGDFKIKNQNYAALNRSNAVFGKRIRLSRRSGRLNGITR